MARRSGRSGIGEAVVFKGRRATSSRGAVWIDDAEVHRALSYVSRAVVDMRPLWDIMDERLREAEADWFESRGGGKWAPLTPGYAKWKAAHGGGGELMVLSGALRQSLAGPGGEHIFTKQPGWMKFGTRNPTGNLWKTRKKSPRVTLDAQSAPIQKAIGDAVTEYADKVCAEWRRA